MTIQYTHSGSASLPCQHFLDQVLRVANMLPNAISGSQLLFSRAGLHFRGSADLPCEPPWLPLPTLENRGEKPHCGLVTPSRRYVVQQTRGEPIRSRGSFSPPALSRYNHFPDDIWNDDTMDSGHWLQCPRWRQSQSRIIATVLIRTCGATVPPLARWWTPRPRSRRHHLAN